MEVSFYPCVVIPPSAHLEASPCRLCDGGPHDVSVAIPTARYRSKRATKTGATLRKVYPASSGDGRLCRLSFCRGECLRQGLTLSRRLKAEDTKGLGANQFKAHTNLPNAQTNIAPVETPHTRSNRSNILRFVSRSSLRSSSITIIPRMPPPSMLRMRIPSLDNGGTYPSSAKPSFACCLMAGSVECSSSFSSSIAPSSIANAFSCGSFSNFSTSSYSTCRCRSTGIALRRKSSRACRVCD